MRRSLGMAVSLYAVLAGGAAFAQEAAPAEAAADQPAAGDIVVTAQKREQSLQDVPLSVQVLGGAELSASQFRGVDNLELVSPSITFARHYHPGANNVTIRGIGTQVSADGGYIQQSVVVSVDGIPASRAAGFWGDLPDVERIEILRGPQGTLFGKNATAGVLNITTLSPSQEFGGFVSASVADDTGKSLAASVTGPLGEGLAARVTAWRNTHEGWGKNYGPAPHDIGYLRSFGVRGKLDFEISPDVTFRLGAGYAKTNTNNQWFLETANDSGLPGQREDEAIYPVIAGPKNDEVNIDVDPFARTRVFNSSAQLDWSLGGGVDLTALVGYTDYKIAFVTDVDQTPLAFTPENLDIHGILMQPGGSYRQDGDELTAELRLHGVSGALDWTVGGFYSRFEEAMDVDLVQMTRSTGLPTNRFRNVTYANESLSAFVDGELSLTDRLTLIAGARITRENFDYSYFRDNSTPLATVQFGPWDGKAHDTGFTARAGARFDITDDVNVYGMWSRGYKGPAIDLSDQARDPANALISAETANSWELGIKSMLFDRRLRLNAALFRTEISNFQAFKIIPPTGTQLVTAGDVLSQGVELDANFQANDRLSFNLGVVYDDGKYQGTIFDCYPGQTAALGCTIDIDGNGTVESQNLDGKPLALLPKLKVNLSARFEQPVNDSGLTFYAVPAFTWQDDVQFSINQDPRTIRKSAGIVDLAIGLKNEDQGWDVSLFAKNLTDEFYVARKQFVQSIGGAYHSLSREYQRYVGLKLDVTFGGGR